MIVQVVVSAAGPFVDIIAVKSRKSLSSIYGL